MLHVEGGVAMHAVDGGEGAGGTTPAEIGRAVIGLERAPAAAAETVAVTTRNPCGVPLGLG